MATKQERRGVFSWMLYDWANQPFHALVITFIFAPYFASQVASDPVTGQSMWGVATAIAGLCVAAIAPFLGAIADRTGAKKPWVAAFSIPFVIGCAGLWIGRPDMQDPMLLLVIFGIAYVGAEFTQVFTNAMLPTLGPPERIGRISGSGWALGYLGGLVSLFLVLAFLAPAPGSDRTLIGLSPILGLDPTAGEPERAVGPLSAIWYMIFALPLFLYTPDTPRTHAGLSAIGNGIRDVVQTVRDVSAHTSLTIYLLASMIYRDALAALFAFGGIYAAGVLGWGIFELGVFGIVAAGTGAVGAWLGGRVDDVIGPRPVIGAAIWLLIIVCSALILTDRTMVFLVPVEPDSKLPDIVFFIAGMMLGVGSGVLGASSRTLLVHQAENRVASAQAFGLYALSGKATAFMGPALIAVATSLTGSQRLGVSPVILLFLIGAVLLLWVKTDDEQKEANPQ